MSDRDRYRCIKACFALVAEERAIHFEATGDAEHAELWDHYARCMKNGHKIQGRQNSATDLFARVYNELHGDPELYFDRFDEIFVNRSEQ